MLFCHIASPLPDRPYPKLREQKKLVGLPGIGFLDGDGELVVQVPPAVHTLERFQTYAARAHELVDLRARARAGDVRAQAALLIAQLDERQLDLATARARRAQLADESAAERVQLDGLLRDLDVQQRILAVQSDTTARRALGREFLAMLARDEAPTPRVSRGFWFVILEHAEAARDAAAFERGLEGLRANTALEAGDAPWAQKMLADYGARLERLRAKTPATAPAARHAPRVP